MKIALLGGSGFMGHATLMARPWDGEYIVLGRDENKLERTRRRFPDVHTVLGDIRDRYRIETLLQGIDLAVVMGAIKHIDEAESNVSETIAVNIGGTENVLRAAAWAGVKTLVFISTDKATAPLNSYGSSKQLGERLVGEYARKWSDTKFVATRFGNVAGSTGSVLQKWHRAIACGDPVAMTDARMTRFWLGAREAVAVIEEATRAPSGTVTIPLCGAMRMGDVATAMGAKDITTIGLRPGERMDEMLLSVEEAPRAVRGDEYITLQPAYTYGRAGAREMGYASREPSRWITPAELREMVEEARALW